MNGRPILLPILLILLAVGPVLAQAPPQGQEAIRLQKIEYFNKALAYYQEGKYNESVVFFNAALQLDPAYKGALKGVAACYYRLGDKRKALENFEKALAVSPGDASLITRVNDVRKEVEGMAPASSTTASAVQTASSTPRERGAGLYLSAFMPYTALKEDLDGETGLVSTQTGEWVFLPSVKTGIGVGGKLGFRGSRGFFRVVAIEGSYEMGSRTVSWGAEFADADYFLADASLKIHVNPGRPVQLHPILGYSMGRMDVTGGSFFEGEIRDTRYDLAGFHAGGGLSIYMSPRIFLSVQSVYRFLIAQRITGADGVGQRGAVDVGCGGIGIQAGLNAVLF